MPEVPEENGSVCADERGCDDDACAVVSEGGSDPLPGSGEHQSDGEELCETLDLSTLDPRLRARFERQHEEETRLTRERREELGALLPDGRVRFDDPMRAHSVLGVGGAAEAFAVVEDETELKSVIAWADEHGVDYRFWGAGSNVLVRDGGLRGVTMMLGRGFDGIAIDRETPEGVFVSVGTAISVAALVAWCAEQGVSGAERLAGLPGTVGGKLIRNAGLDDAPIADIVEEVTIINRECRTLTIRRQALRFEERRLKIPRTAAAVRVLLRLVREEAGMVATRMEEVLAARRTMRPETERVIAPVFRDQEKVAAAVLIDEAGLKGVRVGGARIAPGHANAIINENDAVARDVLVLMSLIRDRVKHYAGVVLENAIEIMGEK